MTEEIDIWRAANCRREASVPRSLQETALHHPSRRVLRVAEDRCQAEAALANHHDDWGNACAKAGAILQQVCEDEGHSEAACHEVVMRDFMTFATVGR